MDATKTRLKYHEFLLTKTRLLFIYIFIGRTNKIVHKTNKCFRQKTKTITKSLNCCQTLQRHIMKNQ